MKVEIVTPSADPDHGGFGLRVHGLVSMFSRFADVRVILTDWFEGPRVPGVTYLQAPVRDTLRTRLGRLRTYYRTDFPRVPRDPPDLAVVESLDLFGLAQFGPEVPIVLDEHNVYWNLLSYELVRSPFFRSWLGRRASVRRNLLPHLLERAKRFEVEALRRSDRTLVTSDDDRRAILRECPDLGPRVHVLPNCVDADRIPALPDANGSRNVVFVGDYNYVPNREAAEFVSTTLGPGIPDARFLLVGADPPPGVQGGNVVATGHVPDLLGALRDASVCVAPLVHGSGTRLKILTYLAAARPVVATTKACEGLPVRDGEHLVIRDDPMEFVDAVRDLLGDSAARRELGAQGRDLVETTFDWRVHVPWVRRFANEVLGGAAA